MITGTKTSTIPESTPAGAVRSPVPALARGALGCHFAPRRRGSLAALLALALLPIVTCAARAAALALTPGQTEGPFYPRSLPADRDSDLTRVAGRVERAKGTPLYLSGRALTREARPIANVTVELWQCDAYGRYHHVGDDGLPRDDNFQGYGVAVTDREGRYAFKTIRPVPYGGRAPHLHVKVHPPEGPVLTTQIYIAGDALDGDLVVAQSPGSALALLTMTLAPLPGREPGALAGTFDFVLR